MSADRNLLFGWPRHEAERLTHSPLVPDKPKCAALPADTSCTSDMDGTGKQVRWAGRGRRRKPCGNPGVDG
jgi:hypothetical protein